MKKLMTCLMVMALMTSAAMAKTLQIKGSDTELNAVQAISEAYMNKNQDASIAVTGGGSGAGFAALINGKADIAIASRSISASEMTQCRAKGISPNYIVFGIDGLSVIVNSANQVKDLSVEQIAKIYKGEITNWKDVGGRDMAISLYGRQSSSGTFVYFRQNVMKGEYSTKMNRMAGNAEIVEGVKADRSGIGYVGVGYTQQNGKVIDGINVLTVNGISPLDEANVVSGKYPVSRPLYHYFNGKPSGDAKAFMEFELSDEGQNILKAQGFYKVTQDYAGINTTNLE
jgi:phosphate transport system substrate-binding protein